VTLLDTTAYESAAITHHVATLGRVPMPYMSAASHLVAVDSLSSKPVANVAFTADGVGPSTRPVTFFCNGGRAPAGSYDNWS
jgi:carboxypeptidase C (cathepsin A)